MKSTICLLTLMALGCVGAQAAINYNATEGSLQEGLAFYWNFDGTSSDYVTATGETLVLANTQLTATDVHRLEGEGLNGSDCIDSWKSNAITFYGDLSDAGISSRAFTISFKIRNNKTTWYNLFGISVAGTLYKLQTGNNGDAYLYEGTGDNPANRIQVNGAAAPINATDGEWANVVLVSDGTSFTLYVNGSSSSYTYTPAADTKLDGFRLGAEYISNPTTRLADAYYDDLAIWNRALTAAEISYLTSGGAAIPEPATATLSLLALAGLAARRRRQ